MTGGFAVQGFQRSSTPNLFELKSQNPLFRQCPLSARLNRRLPPSKSPMHVKKGPKHFLFLCGGGGGAGVYGCRHCLVGTGPYSLQTQRTPEVEPRILALGFRLGGAVQGFGPLELRNLFLELGRTHTYMGPHINVDPASIPSLTYMLDPASTLALAAWGSLDCTLLGSTVCIHKISVSAWDEAQVKNVLSGLPESMVRIAERKQKLASA